MAVNQEIGDSNPLGGVKGTIDILDRYIKEVYVSIYRHRFLCDVLEEMRGCHRSRNFASLLGLIEETQSMGNRMEAVIEVKDDYEKIYKHAKELSTKCDEWQAELDKWEKEKQKEDEATEVIGK